MDMPQTLNKIQRGFSRSAEGYDRCSGLHREIADKLLDRIVGGPRPAAVLDVGCGTGYLTVKIKEILAQSNVVGLDLAKGMLDVARQKHDKVAWVLGDGNKLPFSDGNFDLVISNLAYQWTGDLSGAFAEARRVLVPGGALACTLFGYNTCLELFQSLNEARAEGFQFSRLADQSEIQEALVKSGFSDFKVDREEIKVEFKDMHELIAWLKSIGANNLSRKGYMGRDALSRAASIYHDKFYCVQGVGATFEVIRVYVKK
jgi:malonyl-CoA O-methyltransferase